MADLYFAIADATERHLNIPESISIPGLDEYIEFCRSMYKYVDQIGPDAIELSARSTEFHSFGVTGAPGGERMAQSIWSISHMAQFFALINKASTGIVIDGIPVMVKASEVLDTVYTANTSLLGIAQASGMVDNINNVEVLSWDELRTSPPKVDFVGVLINFLSDEDVLFSLMNSLNIGGVMLLSNASNGSEMYVSGGDSFADSIHRTVVNSGNFYTLHLQGYVSYSCFVKHS